MALDQSALLELVEQMRTAEPNELMRRILGVILQELVDAEATAHIGAEWHERNEDRTTQRNGTRDKLVTTTAGDLTIKIPKVRTGSLSPITARVSGHGSLTTPAPCDASPPRGTARMVEIETDPRWHGYSDRSR